MIELKNVVKVFGETRAVDDLSIGLDRGKIFGLLGPNGAGKTTTIRIILNILAPDSGSVSFLGRPLKDADRERIGYLPEERGLYSKMKCAETLEYFAELRGRPRGPALREEIMKWMGRFGLEEYANRKIQDLSKGMAQKLQFLTTLLHDPDLLILDEPFSGLDPISQNLLLEILQEMKQKGKTILFSTHIMDHAEKICDSISIIDSGRQLIGGALSEIKRERGANSLYLESDSEFPDLSAYPGVKSVLSYPRAREISLERDADSQVILTRLMSEIPLQRFEQKSPSLHAIYSELMGAAK